MKVSQIVTLGGSPTLAEVTKECEKLLEEHPSATDFELVVVDEYGCSYVGVEFLRDSTEAELAERELAKEKALAREKAAYLKLKEKFGE